MAHLAVLVHVAEQRAMSTNAAEAACEWHLAVLVHVVEDRAVLTTQEALHLLLKLILQKTQSTVCQVSMGDLVCIGNLMACCEQAMYSSWTL